MSSTSPETTLTDENETRGADEESTAIPGVVVSQNSVTTEKTLRKKKFWIFIGLAVIAGLAIGLGYSFGTKSKSPASSTKVEVDTEVDAEGDSEVDSEVDAEVATKSLSWKQIGDAINGSETREFFGSGVATNKDGKIVAVLSNLNKHLFKEVNGTWVELDILCGFCKETYGEDFDPNFVDSESEVGWGVELSADGEIAAFGTAFSNFGVAYIRQLNHTTGKYDKLGQPIHGKDSNDEFGTSPSMSEDGSIVAVAALEGDYINFYEQGDSNEWQLTASIDDIKINFFRSQFFRISGDGSRAAVGVPLVGVKIFEKQDSGIWEDIATITTSNATETFGTAVSLSFTGDRVLVSDPRMKDEKGNPTGSLQVFSEDPTTKEWTQLGNTMFAEDTADFFGNSCSMSSDGNRVTAAAVGDQGHFLLGYAKVFDFESGSWSQVGNTISGSHMADWFGYNLQLSSDGTRLVVGSMLFNVKESNTFNGQVRVFELMEQ